MKGLRITVGAYLLVLTLGVPLPIGVYAAEASTVATSRSAALSAIRIGNFGSVNDTYYRGAQPKGRDYLDLAALGVKTIIDFQKDGDPVEPQMVEKAGMRYVRIPMTTHILPTKEQLTQFLSIVNNPVNLPVYVHCAGGRHRTGVMTAIYRMTKDSWKPDQAFAEMKKYHFGFDYLHPEFKKFVLGFSPATIAEAAQAAVEKVTK